MEAKEQIKGVISQPLDIDDVLSILPHRYPFVMVDRIVEIVENERIVGLKNVTANEPFFLGHFPGRPIMPGVLILEAMAQVSAILAWKSPAGIPKDKYIFLVGVNDVKWKKMVRPGDTLLIDMRLLKRRRPLWIMQGSCTVDGKLVASGTLSAMETD